MSSWMPSILYRLYNYFYRAGVQLALAICEKKRVYQFSYRGKEPKDMGRPKGGQNESHSKEEKLALVKRMLNGESGRLLEQETGIYHSQIHKWTKQFLEGGEEALENKRRPGNPLVKYQRKKELTPTEQLEYRIAVLERELLKRNAEIGRLKKSIELKGGDARRR